MSNSKDRLIRLMVACGSFVAVLVVGYPMVDESIELRRNLLAFEQLEQELQTTQQRNVRLNRIEAKLQEQKATLVQRSVLPSRTPQVRDELIEMVRQSGGSLRSLEIQEGHVRRWAMRDDDPTSRRLPDFGMESDFMLHSIPMTLSISGPLNVVLDIQRKMTDNHWLLSIDTLDLKPISQDEETISLEISGTLLGLEHSPKPNSDAENFL